MNTQISKKIFISKTNIFAVLSGNIFEKAIKI